MVNRDWDATFNQWAKGPGKTEEDRSDNAQRMVKDAIDAYGPLKGRRIRVFVQGSYQNRTTVRGDSDVDVCALCLDTFFPDYSQVPGVSSTTMGYTDATYLFADLKRDVEAALVAKFGRSAVTSGDKAFDVRENTYRVAADVEPTFEGRLFYRASDGSITYHSGTVLQSNRTGRTIHNWPDQHYANGVRRHDETSRQFKKKVRCLKNLCNTMCDEGNPNADKMASFLLESLVYNCPNTCFDKTTHYQDMEAVIRHLWNATKSDDSAKNLLEVNRIKYLFHPSQGWDRTTTHQFLLDAWRYVGFGT